MERAIWVDEMKVTTVTNGDDGDGGVGGVGGEDIAKERICPHLIGEEREEGDSGPSSSSSSRSWLWLL